MPKASVADQAVDLASLAYAVLVSEQGSFRLRAHVLGVRTSALSRPVRSLEDSIGVSLFNRTRQGVQVTVAGSRVLKHARSILTDVSAFRQTAQQNGAGAEGRLRVGVVASIACGFSRHLLASFIRDRVVAPAEQVSETVRQSQDRIAWRRQEVAW